MMEEPTMPPAPVVTTTPPPPKKDLAKQSNKCANAKPNCGLLHDNFAAMWGDMKDLVDETTARMTAAAKAWDSHVAHYNAMQESLTQQKGATQQALAEASATHAAQSATQSAKEQEDMELKALYKETMTECKRKIREILFTELCGTIKVRTDLLKKVESTLDIVDCAVGDWTAEKCTVPCDENRIGGNQTLTRDVITKASEQGAACPPLQFMRRCNQIKCPIDCQLSEWYPWTKCTTECGGGVQGRTRVVETKPLDGGASCDALQESRPCNTGSCDRDCTLQAWSPFSPCSKACNGGTKERTKAIHVPTRGFGTCPKDTAPQRYEKAQCNAQPCVGDEQCIANMDLVIAIDGSGSLTERGFETMKKFAAALVRRLKSDAYGHQAVHVAVVQFGNGALDDNDVISDARVVVPMHDVHSEESQDMEAVATQIEGLEWQKGFTNMAQAFLKANHIFRSQSRHEAHAVTLLLTDGRPSFQLQTSNAVNTLKTVSRVIIAQIQAYPKDENVERMKHWASKPSETNYFLIRGKRALKGAMDKFAGQVLVTVCSRSESPSQERFEAHSAGFRLSREFESCVAPGTSSTQDSVEGCYRAAVQAGSWATFTYGEGGACDVHTAECTEWTHNATTSGYEPVEPEEGMPTPAPVAFFGTGSRASALRTSLASCP